MQIRIDFADPDPTADGAVLKALRCTFETPCQTLVAHRPEQVAPLLDRVEQLAHQGLWCVGYLRFEAASAFDRALITHHADGPLAWFGVFDQAGPWPEDQVPQLQPTSPTIQSTTEVHWYPALTRADFDANMARIHQGIAAGAFYQVNYTAALHGDFSGDPRQLFARLQRAQPGGFAAYIDTGDEQILSVSPELFFDWQDGRILTRPMKGTAPRGATAQEDLALAQGLVTSAKERAENVMIVDLLRNDLSRVALPHSVEVPALFKVQSLPTVLQMVSDVCARTRAGTTLAEVFAALFPCGSVTGAPKVRAMQAICELEPESRGVYCGSMGVVRPGGHATFNVAIRTVTLRGNQARCGVGSGITWDAQTDTEWREWQTKTGFLTRASTDFTLLETLRCEAGSYLHLRAHLARLQAAARHFGYRFDPERVDTALHRAANGADQGVWRVRLQIDARGQVQCERFAVTDTPQPVTLALADRCFDAAHSEFTRFKTSQRAHYEAFVPIDPAIFDTLLYNAQGELTECTRGNIALLLDGRWVTPALTCGLLPGIGRAHWLQQGRLVEAVVTVSDLPRVQAIAFVNSLRGWLDAQWAKPAPTAI